MSTDEVNQSKPNEKPSDKKSFAQRLLQLITLKNTEEQSLRNSFDEILEEVGEHENEMGPEGRLLIHNIIKIGEKTVYDIMIPRADIISINIDTRLDEIIDIISTNPHSRYPVYGKDMDDVLGMVHIRDVFLSRVKKQKRFSIKRLLRNVIIAAPQMLALDLLLEMRQQRSHMAMVVDEYGGIDGLITIEDLVEEIVGDIEDEHDVSPKSYLSANEDGSYLANARLELEDLEEELSPFLTDEDRAADIDTLGGLIVHLCKRVPTRGELVKHSSGIEFKVTRADPRRIREIQIFPTNFKE